MIISIFPLFRAALAVAGTAFWEAASTTTSERLTSSSSLALAGLCCRLSMSVLAVRGLWSHTATSVASTSPLSIAFAISVPMAPHPTSPILRGIGGYKSIGHQNLCGMLPSELERFVVEDLGEWDDSSTLVPEAEAGANIIAKEDCIISGLAEAIEIFKYFGLTADHLFDDGEFVPAGCAVLIVRGPARSILQSERLALNFMARMSGISTITRECVLSAGGRVRIAATRKTTPGFRIYEKKAVFLGGGDTHRFNLSDAVLIKDNHIQLLGLEECLRLARSRASFTKKIEVEVESLADMLVAAKNSADIIMFDNMSASMIKEGVRQLQENDLRDRVLLEASGGITPENIEEYSRCGVDVISLGALTRNARWIDLSLEIEKAPAMSKIKI
ncbi:Uncharacterised protein [uncultured archaeon]|nr:Uncharacterised protein [uncultured archaeon]